MIRFKPLPLMSLLSIIAFAVLIAFGRWQWEKYEIKSAAAEEPVAEMTIASYQPVEAGIQFVFAVRPDTHERGWRIFTPVQEGDSVIFVDSDFVVGMESPSPNEIRVPAATRCKALRNAAEQTGHNRLAQQRLTPPSGGGSGESP